MTEAEPVIWVLGSFKKISSASCQNRQVERSLPWKGGVGEGRQWPGGAYWGVAVYFSCTKYEKTPGKKRGQQQNPKGPKTPHSGKRQKCPKRGHRGRFYQKWPGLSSSSLQPCQIPISRRQCLSELCPSQFPFAGAAFGGNNFSGVFDEGDDEGQLFGSSACCMWDNGRCGVFLRSIPVSSGFRVGHGVGFRELLNLPPPVVFVKKKSVSNC